VDVLAAAGSVDWLVVESFEEAVGEGFDKRGDAVLGEGAAVEGVVEQGVVGHPREDEVHMRAFLVAHLGVQAVALDALALNAHHIVFSIFADDSELPVPIVVQNGFHQALSPSLALLQLLHLSECLFHDTIPDSLCIGPHYAVMGLLSFDIVAAVQFLVLPSLHQFTDHPDLAHHHLLVHVLRA
jgi:hypothetical protein